METQHFNLLKKLSRFGVAHRRDLKNELPALKKFLHWGWMLKTRKNNRVYYELSEKALSFLEERRQELWHLARQRHLLSPNSKFYRALVEDLRFLDIEHPAAKEFLLLGDWQLQRPLTPSQLKLAQRRYYEERH